MNPLVRVNGVHKYFTRGSERIDVLKGVNLEIPQGDFLALMGPSGSGKTTLLNLMGGLDAPTGGAVEVGGIDIVSALAAASCRAGARDHIGFVFQLYNLLPVADGRAERRTAAAADEAVEGRAAQARGASR